MSKSRLILGDVVDAETAARMLGVSRWLVVRLARVGKLPGKKVGKEWRFRLTGIRLLFGETEQSGGVDSDRSQQGS